MDMENEHRKLYTCSLFICFLCFGLYQCYESVGWVTEF